MEWTREEHESVKREVDRGGHLDNDEAQRALADIKQGRGGDDDIGAGLVLRKGGEREDERCPGNADAREQPHRDRALRLRAPVHHRAVQRSGTGAMSVKVAT